MAVTRSPLGRLWLGRLWTPMAWTPMAWTPKGERIKIASQKLHSKDCIAKIEHQRLHSRDLHESTVWGPRAGIICMYIWRFLICIVSFLMHARRRKKRWLAGLFGGCLGGVWGVFGSGLGVVWVVFGGCLGVVWVLSEACLGLVWGSFGELFR